MELRILKELTREIVELRILKGLRAEVDRSQLTAGRIETVAMRILEDFGKKEQVTPGNLRKSGF